MNDENREIIKYTAEALIDFHSSEILLRLKKAWGYKSNQALKIIGRLTCAESNLNEIKYKHYRLEDLRSVNDFSRLEYPISSSGNYRISQTVYVPIKEGERLFASLDESDFVLANTKLNEAEHREKHQNPFELRIDGPLEIFTEIPIDLEKVPDIDGKKYIAKELLEFYTVRNMVKVDQQLEKYYEEARITIEEQIQGLEDKKVTLDSTVQSLEHKKAALGIDIESSREKLDTNKNELAQVTKAYRQGKAKMENDLKRLQKFIEEKSSALSKMGLISDTDLAKLTGKTREMDSGQVTVDFQEQLEGDYNQAVKHIQAYLYAKDIYYKQDLLKDFFTLLKTNDLVILAGDSGSGKTNLVKSMASAINGKSVVIPIKPNWTGSEDLLGYYNPLESKFFSTKFLDTLIEASQNPETPYLVCLDEMNLARVEYYFSDFLSLLEERNQVPRIYLYSDTESSHTLSEFNTFLELIDTATISEDKREEGGFVELLTDEEASSALRKVFGGQEGESLLKYHSMLRRKLSNFINAPSSILLPGNVRIIGCINVDETTHYLSPKILDRAHVLRFGNPLLYDWDAIEAEVDKSIVDLHPVKFDMHDLGDRKDYPRFERDNEFAKTIIEITKQFLDKLGIEFGLRTIRQALNYREEFKNFEDNDLIILNNFVLHKILPKMMFDGDKASGDVQKKDILLALRNHLDNLVGGLRGAITTDLCIDELDRVIDNAKSNDWVVNYWSR